MEMPILISSAKRPATAPKPEDVFLSWIFSLPDGADLTRAAQSEIARIDGAVRRTPDLIRLRGLFQQVSASHTGAGGRRTRRARH